MLIDSPRITTPDRVAWDRWEKYDQLIGQTDRRLDRLEAEAIHHLQDWAKDGGGDAGVSWGKDSVVMAHLLHLSGVKTAPLVWARMDPFEMPECEDVRDAFFADHPGMAYEERVADLWVAMRGEPGFDEHHEQGGKGQDVLNELIGGRYVSGVRAEESKIRRMSINRLGAVTKNTCRPLAHWTANDIFAYSHREHLPVHPAYAMTFGGHKDRRWIRVHALCSYHPTKDSSAWEDTYFGDHIRAALELRASRR